MRAQFFRGRTCFEGYAGRLWFRWPRPGWWKYGARPAIGWIQNDVPPCRICGQAKGVAVYNDTARGETICMECCDGAEHHDGETGHQFDHYERGEGFSCRYCGMLRAYWPSDDYD